MLLNETFSKRNSCIFLSRISIQIFEMGCGMTREEHLAEPMREQLEEKLAVAADGVIVSINLIDLPSDVDPTIIVNCIRIGGCVVWLQEPKPHYGTLRTYRNERKVCARRIV